MKSILFMSQLIHFSVYLEFICHGDMQRGDGADAFSTEQPELSSPASELCGDMLFDLSASAAKHDFRHPAGRDWAETAEAASTL